MEIDTRITPALHPGVIEHLEGYSENAEYVDSARMAFEGAYKLLSKAHDARTAVMANPVYTDDYKAMQVSEFINKNQKLVLSKFDDAAAKLEKGIEAIENELSAPILQDAERRSISAEIRAHAKELSTAERHMMLNKAIKEKDHATCRAILGAPAYLSGMTDDDQSLRIRQYHLQCQPQLEKRLQLQKSALKLIHEHGPLIFKEFEKAQGADGDRIQKIRKAHDAANAALKDLSA